MIEPTIGRVVLYHPDSFDIESGMQVNDLDKPFAATIAFVWNDRMVNLSVVDHNGNQFNRTSIYLAQDDDLVEKGMCEWMGYQKGQAAKTEALEKELADVPEMPRAVQEEVVHEAGHDTVGIPPIEETAG